MFRESRILEDTACMNVSASVSRRRDRTTRLLAAAGCKIQKEPWKAGGDARVCENLACSVSLWVPRYCIGPRSSTLKTNEAHEAMAAG